LPGLLVEPAWLMPRIGTPGLRLIDMRDADAYASGHIPGAANLQLGDLGSRVGGLDNVLLPSEAFGRLIAAAGVSNGDAVIVYDDQWGLAAARLVWALHRYGHDEVGMLNGGWDRWEAEDGPGVQGAEEIAPGSFRAVPRAEVSADRAWIAARIAAGSPVLLDTRTTREFDNGHVPGAICWDWFNAVPPDSWNASREPEELRAEWRGLGLDTSDEVIVYCRSGMRAAHTYVVLKNAGFSGVRLYDGSWQEWSMNEENDVGH
jgi:thiosulfate/3-mercaptopyruvate sulfurtransferase